MLDRVSRCSTAFIVLTIGSIAAASTAGVNPALGPSSLAQPAGDVVYLWLAPGRSGAPAADALEILSIAPSHGLNAADYRFDELVRLHRQVVEGRHDLRVEYEGLMTDALLRLFRDLRPQLAKEYTDVTRDDTLLEMVLLEAIHSGNLTDFFASLLPRHAQYESLREALRREEHAAMLGGPAPIGRGPALRVGDSGPRVRALRARLLSSAHHDQLLSDEFDASLELAVQRYQELHGLDADGVVGKRTREHLDMTAAERAARIRLALARWRELPVSLGREYVHVNIPEYRLEMIRDGFQALQMRVVVGSVDDPTPAFTDEIEYLVFNPYWHVPRRIALEELVPKAADRSGYLTSQNYEVLEDGQLVDESTIDWTAMDAKQFDYRIRQRPGPANALGAVKFLFPNPMNIYLHDSPARGLYQKTMRAFSHGCIRLEDPMALARVLLDRQGDWDTERVEQVVDKGNRRQINLEEPVPVYLTYITARVTESGELALFRDIYDRDAAALVRLM